MVSYHRQRVGPEAHFLKRFSTCVAEMWCLGLFSADLLSETDVEFGFGSCIGGGGGMMDLLVSFEKRYVPRRGTER